MMFKLKEKYNDRAYKKILTIIKAFNAVRTDEGWYITTEMYKSMVNAFKVNLGFDPTEPIYGYTALHQVILKDKVEDPEVLSVVRKSQFDPDTGIITMDEKTYKEFDELCYQKGINYYLLNESDKLHAWENETALSLLKDIKEEVETFNYRIYLNNDVLIRFIREIDKSLKVIADACNVRIRNMSVEVSASGDGQTVIFYYKAFQPVIVFHGEKRYVLNHEDIITLEKAVADELVKLGLGEIIEKKGTGSQGEEGA